MATPETPLIEAWAPRVPSRNSRFAKTGSPVRVMPMGTFLSIRSMYRAFWKSSPWTTDTGVPGSGGMNTSGSMRVVWTWAAYEISTGRTPSAARNASLSNSAPSYRLRTWSTIP